MVPDLKLALDAADLADRVTIGAFRRPSLQVQLKADQTPVSDADKAAEAAVRELLGRERPADAVLGEEMGLSGSGGRRWLVDPIDGTANFVTGIPVWATLIGLEVDGRMELGVVSAPALGRRWWARRGEGAYAGPLGDKAHRISVSQVGRLEDATISSGCIGDFQRPERMARLAAQAKRDRGFGDFWSHVLVAEGACDVGLDPVVSVWDVAPLQVIVEEAGGRFSDFSGRPRLDGGSAISSNNLLHDVVLAALGGQEGG